MQHPPAEYNLGICFEKGLGVQVNTALAAELYKRASHAGYADAQHNLAVFFEKGLGGEMFLCLMYTNDLLSNFIQLNTCKSKPF